MLYGTLRSAARIALNWYYGDVIIQGRERIPAGGPVLVVANHPNALVDALLIATTLDRRVLLTAKATLFEHPVLAPLLALVGVVPLRRALDEQSVGSTNPSVSRNQDTFRLVIDALRHDRVVLVFPEGISHDEQTLAPLKTGAARMAYEAHSTGTARLHILPVGLIYEEKERARSAVLVRIDAPIDFDGWLAEHPLADAAALTSTIETHLRRVTLNFATAERGRRAVKVARALASVSEDPQPVGHEQNFPTETLLAARIEMAMEALEHAPVDLARKADAFVARVDALDARLAAKRIDLADTKISVAPRHAVQFALRECLVLLVALPFAVAGRLLHWLPIRITRAVVVRSLNGDPSRDQPAMRTIVIGAVAIIAWYILQIALVSYWAGIELGVLWLVAIFSAAQIDLRLSDRLARARRRARSYFALRADASLRRETIAEIEHLLAVALNLEEALSNGVKITT